VSLATIYDVPAPAKLNLFLHVVGRRADGYHLLQSAFVLIDWCDRLHFERRTDGVLSRRDLGPALPADDLSLRAARALQQASGCGLGVEIGLDKQVPWGAGLGGGSSDAASTLLALNRLWGLNWPRQRLAPLALALGADVPFFVGGDNALVEGIGERMTPLPLPAQWFAVVKPPASIATGSIFASPMLRRDTDAVIVSDLLAGTAHSGVMGHRPDDCAGNGSAAETFGRNDLQPVAEQCCPEVTLALRWLEARFGNSRMTGSGSAVFARAGTGDRPSAAWPVDDLPPHWIGRMCRSLPNHPLRDWAD
jgi:4-diphosphocytidyl-2-C-methyl-D-erythritol kinase